MDVNHLSLSQLCVICVAMRIEADDDKRGKHASVGITLSTLEFSAIRWYLLCVLTELWKILMSVFADAV
jgi:hypothetical protein